MSAYCLLLLFKASHLRPYSHISFCYVKTMNKSYFYLLFFNLQSVRGGEWRHPETCELWWRTGVQTTTFSGCVSNTTYSSFTLISWAFCNLFDSAFSGPDPPVLASYKYPTLPITKDREKVEIIPHTGGLSHSVTVFTRECWCLQWDWRLPRWPTGAPCLPPTGVDMALRFRVAPSCPHVLNICTLAHKGTWWVFFTICPLTRASIKQPDI